MTNGKHSLVCYIFIPWTANIFLRYIQFLAEKKGKEELDCGFSLFSIRFR